MSFRVQPPAPDKMRDSSQFEGRRAREVTRAMPLPKAEARSTAMMSGMITHLCREKNVPSSFSSYFSLRDMGPPSSAANSSSSQKDSSLSTGSLGVVGNFFSKFSSIGYCRTN